MNGLTHDDRDERLSKMITHAMNRGVSAAFIVGVLTRPAARNADDWRIVMRVLDRKLTDTDDDDVDGWFSWTACDGCGSTLGGDRHYATAWVTED